MSYTPTTWANGDTITAAGLNKIEQGIAGSVMIIHVDPETAICDKTWQQVHDALAAGTPAYLMSELEDTDDVFTNLTPVIGAEYMPNQSEGSQYHVGAFFLYGGVFDFMLFVANTANDYLAFNV